MASVSSFQCLGLHPGWQQNTARLLSLPSPQDILDHIWSRSPWALPRCRITNIRVEDTAQNPGFGWEKNMTSPFYNFALCPKQFGGVLDPPSPFTVPCSQVDCNAEITEHWGKEWRGQLSGAHAQQTSEITALITLLVQKQTVQGSCRGEVQPNLHSKRS